MERGLIKKATAADMFNWDKFESPAKKTMRSSSSSCYKENRKPSSAYSKSKKMRNISKTTKTRDTTNSNSGKSGKDKLKRVTDAIKLNRQNPSLPSIKEGREVSSTRIVDKVWLIYLLLLRNCGQELNERRSELKTSAQT